MPKLLKYHRYVNKNRKKKSRWVNEIIPTQDITVSQQVFNEFEDITGKEVEIEE